MTDLVRRRNLGIFTAATLASGWVGLGVNRLTGTPDSLDSPGAGLWLVLPLATSAALRVAGSGWRRTGISPRLPSTAGWYVAGALIYPAVTAGVIGLGRALGWVDTTSLNLRTLGTAMVAGLGLGVVKNFFEESVWRGYLTEDLLPDARRLGSRGDLGLYLGVGLVWGLWHLPYYLYLLDDATMRSVFDGPRWALALLATATMMGWSVMYTELYRLTGSIWPCVLMHTVEDALVNPLVLDGHLSFTPGRTILTSPIIGLITTAAYVGVGLALRAVRRGRDVRRRQAARRTLPAFRWGRGRTRPLGT